MPSGESLTIVRYHLISSHRISSHLTDDLLTEKLGLAGLRSNFVLILIGRYLKLLRGNYLAEYIAPIIEPVANGSIVLEFNLAHVNNRSQVHLQEIAHVQEICQKLIDTMLKTAFDLPLYVQTSLILSRRALKHTSHDHDHDHNLSTERYAKYVKAFTPSSKSATRCTCSPRSWPRSSSATLCATTLPTTRARRRSRSRDRSSPPRRTSA